MKILCTELFAKLDALSHLSLTPKPVVTDLEVHADMPAIAMEEAAPIATSVAVLQAPEEAHAKVCRLNTGCTFLSIFYGATVYYQHAKSPPFVDQAFRMVKKSSLDGIRSDNQFTSVFQKNVGAS
jgi:Mpp10 protein